MKRPVFLIAAAALAAILASAPAPAAAELHLRVSFTENQRRAKGFGRSQDTCRTEYAIKTLGPLLFIETVKSNCRTFQLDDIRGTDGSASAIVFEGPRSTQRKNCVYRARSKVETCSDRSKVRLSNGPELDYKAQVVSQGRYRLGRNGLAATRQLTRTHTDTQGAKVRTTETMKITVAIQGSNCKITEFASKAEGIELDPGRGRAIRGPKLEESRSLVRSDSCRVISR